MFVLNSYEIPSAPVALFRLHLDRTRSSSEIVKASMVRVSTGSSSRDKLLGGNWLNKDVKCLWTVSMLRLHDGWIVEGVSLLMHFQNYFELFTRESVLAMSA